MRQMTWTIVLVLIVLVVLGAAGLWASARLRKPRHGGVDPMQRRRDIDLANQRRDPGGASGMGRF
jgi:hypothetical protein